MEPVNLPPIRTGGLEGRIDLGKLVSLKRFAVAAVVSLDDDGRVNTPFTWLSKILQDACSTPLKQTLNELCIKVLYEYSSGEVDIGIWKDVFDVLLDNRFNRLEIFRIFVDSPFYIASEVVKELDSCDDIEKLRSRPGLVVEVIGKPLSFHVDYDYLISSASLL